MTDFSRKRSPSTSAKPSELPSPSVERPISPPPLKRQRQNPPQQQPKPTVKPSPWQLTWIRDLPDELNKDAVTLKDLIGDPLVSEIWEFNYLHDINFLMDALDADVKHLVKVHIIHGFWKREDQNRLQLEQDAAAFPNVQLHTAFMPEMFGTHHSKMMIIFRHDDTAQVIIHTANMIHKDWTNMANGVWRSSLLPKLQSSTADLATPRENRPSGTGLRFKDDLLSYLRAYDRRRSTCKELVEKLKDHDFSSVRASLIASVPGTHEAHNLSETAWGWAALKRCLKAVPSSTGKADVVVQVSSIATLGAKDDWLQKTLFSALSSKQTAILGNKPAFKVVFPTADEMRRSLDGYASGGSIHTKIQSSQQAKQLEYLRPIFHHWANDSENGQDLSTNSLHRNGGRNRAAPHIKTYIRYNEKQEIDWALLTSANLSKQAWGEAERNGELRIASWEIGVLIWPDLLEFGSRMVGSFKNDTPDLSETVRENDDDDIRSVVGVRVPYSLPLQRYGSSEIPWVATMQHSEPDCNGRTWVI